MQTKLSIISNIIFKYFLIFTISFLWLNFYIDNLIIVGLISIVISSIIGLIIRYVNNKKQNIIITDLKEQEKIKEISLSFYLTDLNTILKFYTLLLQTKRKVEKNATTISWEDCVFAPSYSNLIVTSDDVATIFKSNRNFKKIFIAGISFNEEAKRLAEQIKDSQIILLDEKHIFKVLKKYDLYPDFKIEINKKEKFKFIHLKNIAFTKNNSKHYLISGFIIFITSFFIKYNIYYLVFTTLLFIFSGICYFKPSPKLSDIADEL